MFTDVFAEGLLSAVQRHPGRLFYLFTQLPEGYAACKRTLAEIWQPDFDHLPLNEEIVALIHEHRSLGCPVILATATDRIWADQIAGVSSLFDAVLASDGKTNLKGAEKLTAIRKLCRDNGYRTFSYAGDSPDDIAIWKAADVAYVVSSASRLVRRVRGAGLAQVHVLPRTKNTSREILKALRPWQWVKNSLLFVPLIAAHNAPQFSQVLNAVFAFLMMSLIASGLYVVNDLLDLAEDRCHPVKCRRPFAAGTLPLRYGPVLSAGLLICGFSLAALLLNPLFSAIMALYLVFAVIYSAGLKKVAVADVIFLSALYTLRIVAGGVATDIAVSDWLLTLSVFLFTSLAFAKRHAELLRLQSESKIRAQGRGYVVSDLDLVRQFGMISGYIAVLVFALYAADPRIQSQYSRPSVLWLVCPVALFWISHIWVSATRGLLNEDPIVFALKNRVSLLVGLCIVGLWMLAAFSVIPGSYSVD
ncbi:MAG: UbiA family prenyltransferase [Fuerstiella sp.]|nr:UbiA family prenyltransferase [Fuerstiella sp.]